MDAFDAFNPGASAPIFSTTSVLSLLAVCAILGAAYGASISLLPRSASDKVRALFIWHFFDASVHLTMELAFLYNVFFASYSLLPGARSIAPALLTPMTPPGVSFLSAPARLHGPFYGSGPTAKLWQEYAKADRRWGGADLTIVSLELLTVFVMAPLSGYVCYLCAKGSRREVWFVAAVVATGELYGSWMTFAPEWLCGSPNLNTGNWLHLWVYLVFMNMLWVVLPAWVLYEAYYAILAGGSAAPRSRSTAPRKSIAAGGSVRKAATSPAPPASGKRSVRAKKTE